MADEIQDRQGDDDFLTAIREMQASVEQEEAAKPIPEPDNFARAGLGVPLIDPMPAWGGVIDDWPPRR